jgi:hypothetical protein
MIFLTVIAAFSQGERAFGNPISYCRGNVFENRSECPKAITFVLLFFGELRSFFRVLRSVTSSRAAAT